MSGSTSFNKRILLSITGEKNVDGQEKLAEINELRIKTAAVFLSQFDHKERDNFYRFLLKSSIEKIPFVHIRDDVNKEEIKFFIDRYQTTYFNIHEEHFKILDKWQGFWDKLYLEMNYDSEIPKDVKVRKIGGFCIDLSHFKAAMARGSEEVNYAFLRRHQIKFACNHLNGYDPIQMRDKHTITSLKDFEYLTTLPKYIFGQVIALEVENSIKEQIKFKEYLAKLLDDYFAS